LTLSCSGCDSHSFGEEPFSHPEDWGSRFVRKAGGHLPN